MGEHPSKPEHSVHLWVVNEMLLGDPKRQMSQQFLVLTPIFFVHKMLLDDPLVNGL